ncbi:MAG: PIN domain-containing protein [Spirochaetaceae bacterium]|jgi:predicted nucleic acid-binding protein|nr:PIN domain-containing protein [Spirochaetaceae bacterium]
MTLSYFDSSMVLAILLEEAKKKEAYEYWQNSSIRVSSILLRIETIVSLRRTYEYYKNRLDDNWLIEKLKTLDEYLNEVNYRIIGTKIEREIYLKKELSKCRSLDAIHIATALKFREMGNVDIVLYTFDKTMHELAEHYRFKTNKL